MTSPDDPASPAAQRAPGPAAGAPTPGPDLTPPPEPSVSTVNRAGARREVSPVRNAVEWVVVIAGAVLIALLVRSFVVQSFRIPSGSMQPTLAIEDRVLVNRLSYRFHDVHRGDVIVFHRPDTAPAAPGEPDDLIKRVVGLPGETIVAREGIVYVDDRPLEEPYLPDGTTTTNLDEPVTVPDDELFVMGDNRDNSSDSRFIGTIPEDSVIGRAFAVIWPLSRWTGL